MKHKWQKTEPSPTPANPVGRKEVKPKSKAKGVER
jgi:hypothetical protein